MHNPKPSRVLVEPSRDYPGRRFIAVLDGNGEVIDGLHVSPTEASKIIGNGASPATVLRRIRKA
jgi:hypothetical protein